TGDVTALRQHGADVSAAVFTTDGKTLVTGDVHCAVHVWQTNPAGEWAWARTLEADRPLKPLVFASDMAVAISPDGRQVAACPAFGKDIFRWDLANGKLLRRLDSPEGLELRNLAWSPDGRLLAAGYRTESEEEQGVLLWEVGEGRCLRRQPSRLGHVFALAFSP